MAEPISSPSAEPTRPTAPAAPGGRWVLELVALLALGLAILAVVRAWPDLPQTIPIHFGISGEPDGWGSRRTVLSLPGVALFLYVALSLVQRIPARWYNYPVEITDENRERQHRLAKGMILTLKAVVMGLFAHLTIAVLRTALGHGDGLGPWFLVGWLAAIFGVVGVHLARSLRSGRGG